jgi:hypothetical protein
MVKKIILPILLIFSQGITNAQENISLIAPYNNDTIETKNPLLTWAYLGGLNQNNDRTFYRIIVVELKENQSAEAGIIVNQPLVKMDKVPGTQLFYPYDAPELKEGIWYGWQVQKISNNVIVDKSEAWRFILPLNIPSTQFYKMKIKNDGVDYVANNGKLRFEFAEDYASEDLKFYLYDSKSNLMDLKIQFGDERLTDENVIQIKKTGSNYYELDLGENAIPGNYKLVVLDAKNQKYTMRFKVK